MQVNNSKIPSMPTLPMFTTPSEPSAPSSRTQNFQDLSTRVGSTINLGSMASVDSPEGRVGSLESGLMRV